jgi:hypothetical protein
MMSKKHNQRTRAEILAKRAQRIQEVRVQKKTILPNGQTVYVPQPTNSERLKATFDASKYMPHIGAKEQARAKRCYMSPTFNYEGHVRAAPVMHQLAKATDEEILWQQEYESVF